MNSAKRYLLIALSFAICMTVFAAFAPRIAHAVTATLVQVVNSNANPLPTQPDGRNVVRLYYYETMQEGTSGSFGPSGLGNPLSDALTGQPYSVPAGKRLVIDNVSGFAYPPSGQIPFGYLLNGTSPFGTYSALPMSSQGGAYSGFGPTRDYVEPGNQYLITMGRNGTTGTMFWDVHAVGHLIDCTNGGGC
jgi:hypothetical protein